MEELELIRTMARDAVRRFGSLTLENLRKSFDANDFRKPEAVLLGKAHLACLNLSPENLVYAIEYFCKAGDIAELENAMRLARLYGNTVALRRISLFNRGRMIPALQETDIPEELAAENIISSEQDKEVLDYSGGRLGKVSSREDRLYASLPQTDFLPRYYGAIEIGNGLLFVKESVHYGQPLSDYLADCGRYIGRDEAYGIILAIAKKLRWLHERGIWYLDVKPENFYWSGEDVLLLDLGIARKVAPNTEQVDIYLADPRYVTPEGASELRAHETSDVFQLGVLLHEFLKHRHPFSLDVATESRESEILKYAWPATVDQSRFEPLLNRMLKKNPRERATLPDVVETIENRYATSRIKSQMRPKVVNDERRWILFPARMGIPHKGHISYIGRLIELGFRVLISVQRSYTITARDPIPKWLVMKMVAQSLLARGFHENDFDFVLTPYYGAERELLMHFAMMPKMEEVVAVASGNPGVRRLFNRHAILSQKAVFAFEDEPYEELSWGAIIRGAVRNNDREKFDEYAAAGVAAILSFAKLQSMYGRPEIEFVPGRVTAVLKQGERVLAKTRVFRYSDPESSLITRLKMDGHRVTVTDRYSALTAWTLDDKVVKIEYESQEFDGTDLVIYFVLL